MIEKVYVGYWFWGRPSPSSSGPTSARRERTKADFDPTTAEARAPGRPTASATA